MLLILQKIGGNPAKSGGFPVIIRISAGIS
jgi:hypothetical protein